MSQYTSGVQIVSSPDQYKTGPVIIPGVGSSTQLMKNIKKQNFDSMIDEVNSKGNKIIGICAGFQVLANSSDEGEGVECLGYLPISVTRMKDDSGNFLSCTGWKGVELLVKGETRFSNDFKGRRVIRGEAYFNHEYGALFDKTAVSDNDLFGVSDNYFTHFIRDNIYGFQFHPEKSSGLGRELLRALR